MIKVQCDLCEGSISGRHMFLDLESMNDFFIAQCRAAYKEKYRGTIEALTKRYEDGKAK